MKFDNNEFYSNDVLKFFTYLFIVSILIAIIFAQTYLPVFVHGDAVFQWNGRWAWSLYQNNFVPFANYPVFWPGLWALIYKSIGSFENWIFANLTLIIILFISFLTVFEFKKINPKLFVINLLILIYICIALHDRFFIGYMDGPITLLFFCCLNLIILYSLSKNYNYIFYGAFLISCAAITKQQGFILPAIFIVTGAIFLKEKMLTLNKYVLLILIASSHFVILTFFYGSDPFSFLIAAASGDGGNQSYLNQLSKLHISDQNKYIYSIIELSKRFNILLILLLFFLSLSNIFIRNKNTTSKLGIVFFIFSLVSFFYFSKYGSYDERNGWFIMPLLFGSFICFIGNFDFKIFNKYLKTFEGHSRFLTKSEKKIKSKYIIISTFIFLTAIGLLLDKIVGFQYVQKLIQEQLGDKELAIKAKKLIEQSDECTKIYSNLHIIAYNYHLIKYYDLDKSKSRIIEFGGWNFADFVNNDCKTGQIWILNSDKYPSEFNELLNNINYKIHHPNLLKIK